MQHSLATAGSSDQTDLVALREIGPVFGPVPLMSPQRQPGTIPAVEAQNRSLNRLLQQKPVQRHLGVPIACETWYETSPGCGGRHAGVPARVVAVLPWWDFPLLIGLGLLAGGLAGLLGIGGGLIFAPLLLWLNLPPHQALATSSFAIVPTALAGLVAHLRSDSLSLRPSLVIGVAAFGSALLFGGLAGGVSGWILLSMQTLIYVVLAFVVRDRSASEESAEPGEEQALGWLGCVGCIAGWTAGMLGLGGGLVMVPLMSGPLGLSIHRAVRLSTVAVFCSATAASLQFLHESRGVPWMGLLLGGVAAMAAQSTASRLDQFDAELLVRLLRGLAVVLAIDSCRRALHLLMA